VAADIECLQRMQFRRCEHSCRLCLRFTGTRKANPTQLDEENNMADLRALETKLNALIAKGERIEAVEQYHAYGCCYTAR
jgi:hypothetical protein